MKKIIVALLIFVAIGCSNNEKISPDPYSGSGCTTGLNSKSIRVLIRCSTFEQYLAGNNGKTGGTVDWNNYTGHKWEKCSSCK